MSDDTTRYGSEYQRMITHRWIIEARAGRKQITPRIAIQLNHRLRAIGHSAHEASVIVANLQKGAGR